MHNYGLTWIDNEELYKATYETFKKPFEKAYDGFDPYNSKNSVDPLGALFYMAALNISFDAWVDIERSRQIGKTLQNAVGTWHQRVLGLAEDWKDKGANGGVFDLESISPIYGYEPYPDKPKTIIAEVKNKFNTIKASDEKALHLKMYEQVSSRGKKSTVAYLIQIIPKDGEKYNKPWVPSKAFETPLVRHIDGYSAYNLVFKHNGALEELYNALPSILKDVIHNLDLKSFAVSEADIIKLANLFKSTY